MTLGLLVVSLCLAQTEPPLPPPSPPPLVAAPDELPAPPPPAQSWSQPPPPSEVSREPVEPAVEAAPGTPTVWWKRSLVSAGVGAGVGFGLGTLTSLLMWQATCPGTLCSGSDLYLIVLFGGMVANFTIPAAVSIVGRALGGRGNYGFALLGSSVFGIAGFILSIALTGGGDVPVAMIPVFGTLMLAGAVAGFEIVSFLREPKVTVAPAIALVKGGGMLGLRGSF